MEKSTALNEAKMNANRLAKEVGMVIDKEVEGGEGNGLGEGDAGDIGVIDASTEFDVFSGEESGDAFLNLDPVKGNDDESNEAKIRASGLAVKHKAWMEDKGNKRGCTISSGS